MTMNRLNLAFVLCKRKIQNEKMEIRNEQVHFFFFVHSYSYFILILRLDFFYLPIIHEKSFYFFLCFCERLVINTVACGHVCNFNSNSKLETKAIIFLDENQHTKHKF